MILLDTHVWLWLASDPERLSSTAMAAIEDSDEIGISAISAWEVAMLAQRGRIVLDRSPAKWIAAALQMEAVREIPLTAPVAVAAAALPDPSFPGDPADRFIYATAVRSGASLVTRDRALREFDAARTLW